MFRGWTIFDAIIFGSIALIMDIELVNHNAPRQFYIIPISFMLLGINYVKRRTDV